MAAPEADAAAAATALHHASLCAAALRGALKLSAGALHAALLMREHEAVRAAGLEAELQASRAALGPLQARLDRLQRDVKEERAAAGAAATEAAQLRSAAAASASDADAETRAAAAARREAADARAQLRSMESFLSSVRLSAGQLAIAGPTDGGALPPVTPLTPASLRAVFDRIDSNRNGLLTRAEVIRALRSDDKVRGLLGVASFKQHDSAAHKAFEAVFQGMDADESRNIDFDEFAAELQRRGAIAPGA